MYVRLKFVCVCIMQPSNIAAGKLYESLGYKTASVMNNYYDDGEMANVMAFFKLTDSMLTDSLA